MLEAARIKSGDNWTTDLHEALYGELLQPPKPSPLHLAAVGHYVSSPGLTTLSTLNFDVLLETALVSTADTDVTIGLNYPVHSKDPTIYHLHGAIFDNNAHSPIVGFRDYAELVAQESPWQRQFLSKALQRGPLLLAGTSYRDPDIRQWLHLIIRDEKPQYPVLVAIVREGLGLDTSSFAMIKDALITEWEAIGLTALPMQDLADVALVVRELQYLGKDGYRSPKERARAVWNTHKFQFAELQGKYSRFLSQDSKRLSGVLETKVRQATLWLANGNGKLARWASQGVQYQDISVLKSVPTGHDSPWVSGEALGAEEVKIKDISRDARVIPSWRSVLAIPITVGDGKAPEFASAVLTFGLPLKAKTFLARQENWSSIVEELSESWRMRLQKVAFQDLSS